MMIGQFLEADDLRSHIAFHPPSKIAAHQVGYDSQHHKHRSRWPMAAPTPGQHWSQTSDTSFEES